MLDRRVSVRIVDVSRSRRSNRTKRPHYLLPRAPQSHERCPFSIHANSLVCAGYEVAAGDGQHLQRVERGRPSAQQATDGSRSEPWNPSVQQPRWVANAITAPRTVRGEGESRARRCDQYPCPKASSPHPVQIFVDFTPRKVFRPR